MEGTAGGKIAPGKASARCKTGSHFANRHSGCYRITILLVFALDAAIKIDSIPALGSLLAGRKKKSFVTIL